MNIRLMVATGLALIAVSPRLMLAAEDALKKSERAEQKAVKENPKSQGTEEIRLERKCAQEKAKDERAEDRDRKHPRRDNKWDELCAPPPPPVVVEPEPVPPPQQPVPPM